VQIGLSNGIGQMELSCVGSKQNRTPTLGLRKLDPERGGKHSNREFRDNFGTPTWESGEKEPFGCSLVGASQRILYGGRWWLPPSPGRGVSYGPKCPWLVLTPKGVPECELTTWVVCFGADSSLIN